MNVLPQNIQQLAATSSTSPASSTVTTGGSSAMADPATLLISSIAGAVDSIFGTIGDAVQGKTKKDLMRQQGNQQLVQNAVNIHQKRLQYAQPKVQKKDHTTFIMLGIVAVFVFTILVFALKKS